jgi:hypothetical protein
MNIKISMARHQPLVIDLQKDPVVDQYTKVLARNLANDDFVFRDPVKYTPTYFQELCKQVKEELNWDWITDDYSFEQTTKMHKFIESALDKTESFKNIPGYLQNLIHEAHFCIHQIQYMKTARERRSPSIQIEWFNDDYETLPAEAQFMMPPDFGDLIIQNPYVGHPPIQCWQQKDYKNISRTCQFPDIIKPGIKIITKAAVDPFNLQAYKSWWFEKCGSFVEEVGWDKIQYYTGFLKIGQVVDKDNLHRIVDDNELLNIEKIELL